VGKIVTIFYAIVGMPLTVLCWSNIGAAMANAFRLLIIITSLIICLQVPTMTTFRSELLYCRHPSVYAHVHNKGA
jgi:hypothetical protein